MPGLFWVNGMYGFILGEQDAFATSLIKKIAVTLKTTPHNSFNDRYFKGAC